MDKNSGMGCRRVFGFACYHLPTLEVDTLPADVQAHLQVCRACRIRFAQLRAALKLLHKQEKKLTRQAKKAAAELFARAGRFAKRKGLTIPEIRRVDCATVQPFLHLATDPLGEIFPPGWMKAHLQECSRCEQEYERMAELRKTLVTAEWIASGSFNSITDIYPDAKPSVARLIRKLAVTDPQQISCEQVKPYYSSIAVCAYDPPILPRVYLHARRCTICRNRIIQLRTKLDIDIPYTHSGGRSLLF